MSEAPETLLSIDVVEELRAVSSEEVHGPWQVPAELARCAFARGADEVDVAQTGRGFRFDAPWARLTRHEMRALAAALDERAAPAVRHDGLSTVEDAGLRALLWAGSVDRAVVQLTAAGLRIVRDSRRGGVRLEAAGSREADSVSVELGVRGWERNAAAAWLAAAVRFAPHPVRLDGVDIRTGFREAGWRISLRRPLPASILVGGPGDAPSLWLLQHGVVSTRATIPGYPPFRAAVELGGLRPAPATPAELRTAVTGHLPALVEAAVAAMLKVATPGLGVVDRRLRLALTAAAERGVLRERVLAAPVVPWEQDGGPEGVSLAELESRAGEQRSAVPVRDPDVDGGSGVATGRAVLTSDERATVSELLGVAFRPLPLPPSASLEERVGARIRGWWSSLLERLPGTERDVAEQEWTRPEQALAAAVRSSVPHDRRLQVGFHDGRRRRRRSRSGAVLLPRDHPVVRNAAALVATDDRWARVAARAVLGARDV